MLGLSKLKGFLKLFSGSQTNCKCKASEVSACVQVNNQCKHPFRCKPENVCVCACIYVCLQGAVQEPGYTGSWCQAGQVDCSTH